ncbi:MAG TPA: DUF4199 domain-containing protein [candidate division Zixibacteria bacterium]|nr:DUF4199 domain-containing protein [candidate division Zixibacteria bacterium]
MKKVAFVFGLVSGFTVSIFNFIIMSLGTSGKISINNGDIFGYVGIVIALSMIFFGIKSYRDKHQNGVIKFGKAFLVGFLISLIASVTWAAVSEVYYQIDPEKTEAFMEKYSEYQLTELQKKGAPQVEIDAVIKESVEMKEMHKNPLARIVMSLAILMPGIIIALISAAILRKKEVLPA